MKKTLFITTVFLCMTALFSSQTYAQVFTNYTTANTSTTLCNNANFSFGIDAGGNKWFGTWGGVSKFDGNIWITYATNGLLFNVNSELSYKK